MSSPDKICFLTREFGIESPAQQLLDRFLMGYPVDGTFHRPEKRRISIHTREWDWDTSEALRMRARDFGLERFDEPGRALDQAEGILVIPDGGGAAADEFLIRTALENAKRGGACFVFGALGRSRETAREFAELAEQRGVKLCAGTALPVTWRLPQVDLQPGTAVKEALIVVQGEPETALFEGLEGIVPIVEKRADGASTVRQVQTFSGDDFRRAEESKVWSGDLLAAAISRSDSPQGDPVADGRTQDLVGLGLVGKLVRDPRAWVIDFEDGLRTTILRLNGVVADVNFALQPNGGGILSAQIYRPPGPAAHEFSRLTAVIENYFAVGRAPWSVGRSLQIAEILERSGILSVRQGGESQKD